MAQGTESLGCHFALSRNRPPLEQLQQDYSKRLDEWENAFAEWRTMSGLMQRENAALNDRVSDLSEQVQSLSVQLRRLSGS
ncbi:MbeD family mobilization/exclusion protein [Salmonella enterica subsp. enterica serovar Senftenberg]|nr:MbeD family mobilization/exclusion protein [Salmonella enterica subsp. enterica serovar Senftenberg]